jgi:C4-dicarboxylate-specific signal transduction histidine kinase
MPSNLLSPHKVRSEMICSVLAGPVQIEPVLLNLLRNAMIEAASAERRFIVVEAQSRGKHDVEISVADSGPGVATR